MFVFLFHLHQRNNTTDFKHKISLRQYIIYAVQKKCPFSPNIFPNGTSFSNTLSLCLVLRFVRQTYLITRMIVYTVLHILHLALR